MKASDPRGPVTPVFGILFLLFFLSAGCGDNEEARPDGPARAFRASTWAELIGGPDAYGLPGDFVMENGKIRVVIQDAGESYSTGLYGGSLLDADRVRKGRETCCGHGLDKFQEVVPTVNTLVPRVDQGGNGQQPAVKVFIKSDGSDGGPAVVTVEGERTALLSLLGAAVSLLTCDEEGLSAFLPPDIVQLLLLICQGILYPEARLETFSIDYLLYPGKDYVEILTRVKINGPEGEPIPARDTIENFDMFKALLAGDLVFGNALFFGVDVDVFGPRFGYYLDGYIWDLYTKQGTSTLNQPIVTNYLAGSSEGVSYGMTTKTSNLQIPLFSSSLSVVFSGKLEYDQLTSNEVFFTNYFIVGEGDVASVLDSVYEIRGTPYGTVEGHVYDSISFLGLSETKVMAFRDPRDPRWGSLHSGVDDAHKGWVQWVGEWNAQHPGQGYDLLEALLDMVTRADMESPLLDVMETDRGEDLVEDGSFQGRLEVPAGSNEGDYLLLAHDPARPEGALVPVTVRRGETTRQALALEPPGKVWYEVRDGSGDLVPAKITLRGLPLDSASSACRNDDMDPACKRYGDHQPILGDGFLPDRLALVEHTHTGQGTFVLRPGVYEYWVSRGPEYTIDHGTVEVNWRHVPEIRALVRQVVDSRGYMSFDVHQHCQKSQDSGLPILDRLITNVAHQLEVLNGTDHDYITDYRPYILDLDIGRFIHSIISDELTTFEIGHFIGFPLKYDPAKDGNGAPPWIGKTPDQIFTSLRDEAGYGPGRTVVHVPHPRDSLFGLFYMFGLDPGAEAKPEDINPETRKSRFLTGNSILSIANPVVKPLNFSERFESMELLNSKRLELIRTPTQQEYDTVCEMIIKEGDEVIPGTEKNCRARGRTTVYDIMERTLWEQDKILRDPNYRLAADYMQILDDWFAYLNSGVNLTALAGSDSHTKIREEPGVCRNYLRFSTDQPMLATDEEVAQRVFKHEATVSYGPFVDFSVNQGQGGIGSLVSDPDGQVSLHIRVETPAWFGVDRIEIYGNGLLIGELDTDASVGQGGKTRFSPWGPGEPKPFPEQKCYTSGKTIRRGSVSAFDDEVTCVVDEDTWFVVIAMGRDNMFPLYTSNEYPYIQIGALISIALESIVPIEGLLGKNPSTMFAVYPYAMTNPIWVDVDGNAAYDIVRAGAPLNYSGSQIPGKQRQAARIITGIGTQHRDTSKAVLNRPALPLQGPRPSGVGR